MLSGCLRRSLSVLLAAATLLLLAVPTGATAAPKQPAALTLRTPINLVFLGYAQGQINRQAILDALPATYVPVVRFPRFYGLPGRDLGLEYDFRYRIVTAPPKAEAEFFEYLGQAGTTGDPTALQQAYNDQNNNVLDVTGPVRYIDGPSVEAWLSSHFPARGYTIYFINWYARPDFQFHVYTKTDEPDHDTGVNAGEVFAGTKMVAWGGTSSRSWFYDHSAGPEAWGGNFNVDDADLDGDDAPDYRIPPIWEYAADGYRDPALISADISRLVRFVAINLLFTSSPLYDPLVTQPLPGGDKVVNIAMLEDNPATSGLDWIDPDFIRQQLADFQPYYGWQSHLQDHNPIDAGAQQALRIFAEILVEDDCWNAFGFPFAQLFCYTDANRATYVPQYDPEDYVAPVLAFNTTNDNMGVWFGLGGFADDNWVDGTQTYVFQFNYPALTEAGVGMSFITIHEIGHHIGSSHTHDGYDSELDFDYGPGGDFYFAWAGDESHSVMSYLGLTTEFGVFDQDNMNRWEMAAALAGADELAGLIEGHPERAAVQPMLAQGSEARQRAVAAFENWDFAGAAQAAREYEGVVRAAADQLGLAPAARLMSAGPIQNVPRIIDVVRPRN